MEDQASERDVLARQPEQEAAPDQEQAAPSRAVDAGDADDEAPDLPVPPTAPGKRDYSYTFNRELSWLQFNRRVLEESVDPSVPCAERLKFISIFQTNLDEFFMVRVGSLSDLYLVAPDDVDNKTGWTPDEQLDAIFDAVKPLVKYRDKVYRKTMKELSGYGVEQLKLGEASKKERRFARDYYRSFVRPVLSPQVIDERHPFPHLKNKELYVAALLADADGGQHLGIVPVPDNIDQEVFDPQHPLRFVRIEDLIVYDLDKLFGIYEVSHPCVVSVTRNADISFDEEKFADDEGDYRLHISRLLKKRNRLNPVRLEVQGGEDAQVVVDMLADRLGLESRQVFFSEAPLRLDGVFALGRRLAPEQRERLCYPPFVPRESAEFEAGRPILEQVAEGDRILFYPYDSMEPYLRMLHEAAHDPAVVSIKITVYRLASDSRVARHLIEAAENGKEVTALMELRARFDEANNIDWAERLERAGCNIIYGMENYKCHSKVCLVTRNERGTIAHYTQIGTGNYNEKTATLYTDLCLFTANQQIGRDAVTFFQNMLIGNLNGAYNELLVAPVNMKRTLLALMDREIGKGSAGRITVKANSITDRDVIDKLMEASCAGVQIRMNIRSICCLLPGVEGRTENVQVRSIVGQFLEHSRIYCFGTGGQMEVFISSADLMTRNLVHRVEVACPIYDENVKAAILRYLDRIFADTVKARKLKPSGKYGKLMKNKDKQLDRAKRPDDWFCLHDYCIEHPLQEQRAPTASRAQTSLLDRIRGLFGSK